MSVPVLTVNGAEIPRLGFGTWQLEGSECVNAVKDALDIGYRHVDTAQIYDNEAEVGKAIEDSEVQRDDIFLTTKIWMDNVRAGDLENSLKKSLEKLRVDHVDLTLIHWPVKDVPLEETMTALNAARKAGLTRHIGVSNFTTQILGEAIALSEAPLVTNQVEYHPFLDQSALAKFMQQKSVALTAYSPISQGKVFGNPVMKEIAGTHGKTEAQIALRWLIQQDNVIAIPRSSSRDHARSNFDIFDFELTADEMGRISQLGSDDGRLIDPDWAPDWDRTA